MLGQPPLHWTFQLDNLLLERAKRNWLPGISCDEPRDLAREPCLSVFDENSMVKAKTLVDVALKLWIGG